MVKMRSQSAGPAQQNDEPQPLESSSTESPGMAALPRRCWQQVTKHVGPPDAGAAGLLLLSTVYLVARNGGRAPGDMLWVLAAATAVTLLLVPTLRRLPLSGTLLYGAWSASFLVAVAAAEIRAEGLRPLTAAALAPAIFLSTVRVWQRRWGPAVLAGVLALAAGRSWWLAFLAWWGGSQGRPTWLALSWHNQSGTLMGVFGVAAAGVTAVLLSQGRRGVDRDKGRGPWIAMSVALAGVTLAGTWLSGSRGAVIATAGGLLALAVGLGRRYRTHRSAVALAAVGVVAVAAVAGLEGMVQAETGSPLATRDQTAGHNLVARLGYWEAAAGMAATRPVTGWGPGSYRWASVPFYPSDVTLTGSAHNEYLEALAEGGLVGALPVWLASLCFGWLALGVLLRPTPGSRSMARQAGAVSAAACAILLLVHAGVDFDWDYPLLLALLALCGGVLVGERLAARTAEGARPTNRAGALAAGASAGAVLILLVIAVAAVGLARKGHAPWEMREPLGRAVAALQVGDVDAAESALDRVAAWNPGAAPLLPLRTMVAHHRGQIPDSTLAAAVDAEATGHTEQLLVAQRLYRSGSPAAARALVDRLKPVLENRRVWKVGGAALGLAALRLATEAALRGCGAAAGLVDPTRRWLSTFGIAENSIDELLVQVADDTGCTLHSAGE